MNPRVAELIEMLRLEAHPEGGYFREVFRSADAVRPADERGTRAGLTAIYFLLAEGQHSRWHRLRSDELWQFCAGEPLELLTFDSRAAELDRNRLGPLSPVTPAVQAVQAGLWQAARPLGSYSLVVCTMGPGFEYADFEFLKDSPAELQQLLSAAPDLAELA